MPAKSRSSGAPTGAGPGDLDAVNRRLLAELSADPRLSMSALARLVEMSAPAVTERVQRLERDGIISGYRMIMDPAAIGLPVTSFVRVRPGPGQLPKLAALAEELVEITECYRITGEDCFLIKLHAASMERLEETLDRLGVYGQTTTSIVVSTVVPQRSLPLRAE